ncbi:hypothetical protein [Lactococcus cremoris]|uniref:3-dehydroquinate synthase family protein n=1 Tax=Lactococcus lactis subsp. cremoris TaxID=1359 RepID=UPI002FC72FBF
MSHSEQMIENQFIQILSEKENQWTYRPDLKSEEALWQNFRSHLNRINLAVLEEQLLTDKEFKQVKVEFSRLTGTPFLASQWLRGENGVAQVLLEREDGKTGINSKMSKNMIGTFTQPDGVLIDPEVLQTLGQREFREGLGEVIKCALIADKDLWNLLTDLSANDLVEKLDKIEEIIYRSCEVKRKVVVDDELDNGVRLYLNFGHTIGHSIENTAGYGKVMHGEAVAIGMVQISKIAIPNSKVLCPKELLTKSEKWSKNMVYLTNFNLGMKSFCLKP